MRIVICVSIVHCMILGLFWERSPQIKPEPAKIVVQTVKLQPQRIVAKQPAKKKAPAKKPVQRKKAKAAPKKAKPKAAPPPPPDSNYKEDLAQQMQLMMRLPEYGTVRVSLTLTSVGKVKQVDVLSAASEKNRLYVLQSLPELSFSPFGKYFAGEREHVFCLTLNNET